jgi:GAF domain-containing protein
MVDHVQLLHVLVEFARTLVQTYDLDDVLTTLSTDVARLLQVDGAGVMLADADGALRFIAASDNHIGEVERLQSETGEGPCVQAYATGHRVVIDDLGATDRFPHFTPRARTAGMCAVYSFPMQVEGRRIGALNLYRTTPGHLGDDAVTVAQLVGDLATSYILSVDAAERAARLAEQLQHALDSRVVIEQAKGKLSLAWDTGVAEAFERLRRYARGRNRRLRQVAAEVLDGRLHPDDIDDVTQPARTVATAPASPRARN